MLEITGRGLTLAVAEDGSSASVADRRRACSWHVDLSSAGYRLRGDEAALRPLSGGRARRIAGGVELRYPAAGGTVVHRYLLATDHVEVRLECDAESVESVSLPGPFRPDAGSFEVAVPLYQGVLLGPGGPEWEMTVGQSGWLSPPACPADRLSRPAPASG